MALGHHIGCRDGRFWRRFRPVGHGHNPCRGSHRLDGCGGKLVGKDLKILQHCTYRHR